MKLNYKKSQSSIKPDLIDTTSSKKYVYLRQNVVEINSKDEQSGEDRSYFEYDEAKLTKSEYEEYLKELNNNRTIESIEDLKVENKQLSQTVNMLTECILEMSEKLYV